MFIFKFCHAGDPGQFIVILILVAMAVPIMVLTWREVRRLPRDFPGSAAPTTSAPVDPGAKA